MFLLTQFTLHRAAPVEFTVAARAHLDDSLAHVQTARPAQSPTAAAGLQSGRQLRLRTHTLTPQRVIGPVCDAVIRGMVEIDQSWGLHVARGDRYYADVTKNVLALAYDGGVSGEAVLEVCHDSTLVLLPDIITYTAERWELFPAGLCGAAAGDAVAFTDQFHRSPNSLERKDTTWSINTGHGREDEGSALARATITVGTGQVGVQVIITNLRHRWVPFNI